MSPVEFMNTHTLNVRLRELLRYALVKHHIIREERRAKWYAMTEKGIFKFFSAFSNRIPGNIISPDFCAG